MVSRWLCWILVSAAAATLLLVPGAGSVLELWTNLHQRSLQTEPPVSYDLCSVKHPHICFAYIHNFERARRCFQHGEDPSMTSHGFVFVDIFSLYQWCSPEPSWMLRATLSAARRWCGFLIVITLSSVGSLQFLSDSTHFLVATLQLNIEQWSWNYVNSYLLFNLLMLFNHGQENFGEN